MSQFKRELVGSAFYEGFGECAVRHCDHEILCPLCCEWKAGWGNEDALMDDNTWRPVCNQCSESHDAPTPIHQA